MDAGQIFRDGRSEVEGPLLELQRREPAGRVGARGVERDVAQVEQARVADDDVQPERHHREDEHHDHRSRPRDEVADQRQDLQRLHDERVDERDNDHAARDPPAALGART